MLIPMKELKRMVFESKVKNKTAVQMTSEILPKDEVVHLLKYGVCCPYAPDGSFIALQFGNDKRWNTLRVATGSRDYHLGLMIKGDGESCFRILAKNEGEHHKRMFAWAEYGGTDAQ